MHQKQIALTITGMLLCFTTIASAGLVPVGDPVQTNSWEQRFNEAGAGTFDLLAVQIATRDTTLASPAQKDFSDEQWILDMDEPTVASAVGPATDDMEWNVHFTGECTDSVVLDYVCFDGEEIVNAARGEWDGSEWSVTNYPDGEGAVWQPDRSAVVHCPVPGAVLLGALGLGLVARVTRRLL